MSKKLTLRRCWASAWFLLLLFLLAISVSRTATCLVTERWTRDSHKHVRCMFSWSSNNTRALFTSDTWVWASRMRNAGSTLSGSIHEACVYIPKPSPVKSSGSRFSFFSPSSFFIFLPRSFSPSKSRVSSPAAGTNRFEPSAFVQNGNVRPVHACTVKRQASVARTSMNVELMMISPWPLIYCSRQSKWTAIMFPTLFHNSQVECTRQPPVRGQQRNQVWLHHDLGNSDTRLGVSRCTHFLLVT